MEQYQEKLLKQLDRIATSLERFGLDYQQWVQNEEQRNEAFLNVSNVPDEFDLYCEICDKHYKNNQSYQKHLKSKYHNR